MTQKTEQHCSRSPIQECEFHSDTSATWTKSQVGVISRMLSRRQIELPHEMYGSSATFNHSV